ncbi:phosphatase [Actinacidiphila sp. ITFR-21]|uniref:phosphatase n=1 Tax=Actinacidiphila sp. ITFR-21 TaxID=3075199 RepID=UPI00288B026B|nr:phosphatase [Streptomyces sp. ITFR-21]WNI17126.1 phosphatase [Streptomyces sp. ITFR-21]
MLSVGALRAHLVATRLAGRVATSREGSLRNYRLFAARDPRQTLGLDPVGAWGTCELLRLMADRCGVSPDPAETSGEDTIDPDCTVAALDAFAERLGRAAHDRIPVLLGTGHPHRLLGFYASLAAALSAAGCAVLTPAYAPCVDMPTQFGVRKYKLHYIGGVAVARPAASGGPDPGAGSQAEQGVHTHSPLPVRAALAGAAEHGGMLPGLVVGDHGFICGAGQLGIEAIGLGDPGDPAVFVAEAEGRVSVAVPLDDTVRSDYYRPLTRYVLNRAWLSQ